MGYPIEQQLQMYLDSLVQTKKNLNDEISLKILERDMIAHHIHDVQKIVDTIDKGRADSSGEV